MHSEDLAILLQINTPQYVNNVKSMVHDLKHLVNLKNTSACLSLNVHLGVVKRHFSCAEHFSCFSINIGEGIIFSDSAGIST